MKMILVKSNAIVLGTMFLLGTGLASAAQANLTIQSAPYTLTSNSAGGSCTVTNLGAGGVTVACNDGAGNAASANTLLGCLTSSGSGQCNIEPGPLHTNAATSLNCGGSNVYNLSTGNQAGNCIQDHDTNGNATTASCSDGNGNSSSADCRVNSGSGNCTGSSGAGSCLKK